MAARIKKQLPTVRLYGGDGGNDDDLLEWLESLEDGTKSTAIKTALRCGLDSNPPPERGQSWILRLLQERDASMPGTTAKALSESAFFEDAAIALEAIERLFDSQPGHTEMMYTVLRLACRDILARIDERRQHLSPHEQEVLARLDNDEPSSNTEE